MDLGVPDIGLGTQPPQASRDVKEREQGTFKCKKKDMFWE